MRSQGAATTAPSRHGPARGHGGPRRLARAPALPADPAPDRYPRHRATAPPRGPIARPPSRIRMEQTMRCTAPPPLRASSAMPEDGSRAEEMIRIVTNRVDEGPLDMVVLVASDDACSAADAVPVPSGAQHRAVSRGEARELAKTHAHGGAGRGGPRASHSRGPMTTHSHLASIPRAPTRGHRTATPGGEPYPPRTDPP